MDEIRVNDGKGLMDSEGLIDTLIIDCNELPKTLMEGQYVHFCAKICEMVQKLSRLKSGVKSDMESRDEMIRELRETNDTLATELGRATQGKEAEDDS